MVRPGTRLGAEESRQSAPRESVLRRLGRCDAAVWRHIRIVLSRATVTASGDQETGQFAGDFGIAAVSEPESPSACFIKMNRLPALGRSPAAVSRCGRRKHQRLPVYEPASDGRSPDRGRRFDLLLMAACEGSFTAQEIEHASAVLGECSERCGAADEPEHATFALEPDSLTGWFPARIRRNERGRCSRSEPLFAHHQEEIRRYFRGATRRFDLGRAATDWMEGLISHWQPDRKVVARRAERDA